jgi:hypothetical protein
VRARFDLLNTARQALVSCCEAISDLPKEHGMSAEDIDARAAMHSYTLLMNEREGVSGASKLAVALGAEIYSMSTQDMRHGIYGTTSSHTSTGSEPLPTPTVSDPQFLSPPSSTEGTDALILIPIDMNTSSNYSPLHSGNVGLAETDESGVVITGAHCLLVRSDLIVGVVNIHDDMNVHEVDNMADILHMAAFSEDANEHTDVRMCLIPIPQCHTC